MNAKMYNDKEMENMMEIGRHFQGLLDTKAIQVDDSKDAFALALQMAVDFEEHFPDPDDYYTDLEMFVVSKIVERFGGD